MSPQAKRYQFDNPLPVYEPRPLPARRPDTSVAQQATQVPDQAFSVYAEKVPVPQQIVHIHQAPPDRTLQRVALGAGMGGGAVAAAVYFGPLLVASMWSIAIVFAVGGLVLAVIVRGITAVLGTEKPNKRRR